MNSISLAKSIADAPDAYSIDQIREAFAYLDNTRKNGGVRNSERAQQKLERRLRWLTAALEIRLNPRTAAENFARIEAGDRAKGILR